MYQSFFVDVVDSFIEYIQLLDADEIEQLDDDLKVNGYGAKCLLEIENACEMLTTFQMFYYFNGKLPLTNGLLIVPDGEATEGTEKIKLNVYLRCLKTNSHGVSFHSVSFWAWNISWASSFYTKTCHYRIMQEPLNFK